MNVLDIAIVTVILFNMMSGMKKGFVRIVSDILAFAGGIFVGVKYSPELAPQIQALTGATKPFDSFISFAIIWAVIFLFVSMISNLVHQVLKFSVFKPINKAGGLVLGGVKGAVVVLPLILPMVYLNFPMASESAIVGPVKPVLQEMIADFISGSDKQSLAKSSSGLVDQFTSDPERMEQLKSALSSGAGAVGSGLQSSTSEPETLDRSDPRSRFRKQPRKSSQSSSASSQIPEDVPADIQQLLDKNNMDWEALMKELDKAR